MPGRQKAADEMRCLCVTWRSDCFSSSTLPLTHSSTGTGGYGRAGREHRAFDGWRSLCMQRACSICLPLEDLLQCRATSGATAPMQGRPQCSPDGRGHWCRTSIGSRVETLAAQARRWEVKSGKARMRRRIRGRIATKIKVFVNIHNDLADDISAQPRGRGRPRRPDPSGDMGSQLNSVGHAQSVSRYVVLQVSGMIL